MALRYLKDESYYSDLYDRHTVDTCRSLEKRILAKGGPKFGKIPEKAIAGTPEIRQKVSIFGTIGKEENYV